MTTTAETYLSTQTSFTNETNTTTTATTTNNEDQSSSAIAANVTIDELVQSCCTELLPSSSQLNSSSSASPTHLVRFVHSQSSLVSQIDEQQRPSEQGTTNSSSSSHDAPVKQQQQQQPPLINVTRLPSPFKPKTIIESTNSMQNTTNLSNITANNISVNNYNVNIHTTNVQQQPTNILNNELVTKKCQFDEKQTTEIVSQILKNIKEVDEHQANATTTTTNYNIHIDSFNFSSTNQQQQHHSTIIKKSRVKKEATALTRIILKDETLSRSKKPTKNLSTPNFNLTNNSQPMEFLPVPYGWQRRILAPDVVVYLTPTNVILDSLDAIRQYLEMPTSCKCGLQCPLIVDKVFNFDSTIKSKSWEVTQVLEGTHCRQKSNILEMATLTNCIDSFCETEQKPVKRRKRTHAETANGNVFVCASNSSNILQANNESAVFVNSTNQAIEGGQSMTWTPLQQSGVTPPSKRPRGRPRKTAVTPPAIAQLAVKPSHDNHQPVPSSLLSPPASVSSTSQTNLVHRNSTSPSTHHQNNNNNNNNHLRYINDNVLTPSSTTDTNVIARVPSLFEQVKTTTNESTFAVLSGVQNVLLSPNRDTNNNNNNNNKRVHIESASSVVSATGKPVTLNVNALKPDFVRSPAAAQKPCSTTPNQIDVISLMGANNSQTQLMVTKTTSKPIAPVPSTTTNSDEYTLVKSSSEQTNDASQPLMIDFNDPSTTNFLLSALASGASSDSNAIVNHLFQKAQTQQQRGSTPPPPPPPSSPATIKKKPPSISSGLKNCTETTNLLPITNSTNRQPVVLHVPATTITNDYNQQSQQIIFSSSSNNNNGERKQPQQIFFINNKPYVIQQKLTHDQSSQQRLVLTPSISQSDAEHTVHNTPHTNRTIAPAQQNSTHPSGQSTLDDGGNCLVVNGVVEPRTLSSLLKGLNPSSFSGVDNLIDTIHRFEHTTPTEQNDNLSLKPSRPLAKSSPARKTNPDKPPPRRRAPKKLKQEQQPTSVTMPPPPPPPPPPPLVSQPSSVPPPPIQPIVADQQQWQTDFNSFDFTTAWGSDTNLNSLLLNDDFDTAASFDDVNFGDFEPYMNGNNNPNATDSILPSLFGKPLPPDTLPGVDHLLP
ncbi:unnamed protein product [Rotaria socialis]|uniref:MBD domain-containing protein n=1 Tax=Rotaria socialis TaxID=392032 RepID=A0A818K5T6_9BILA|nr:unnamed protein product [Rotaria socialis]CAF3554223.1 unnamed protein product [Rotaria socialis]CAF4438575.1 unnamed protein product [Rotaria socialis]CAF4439659.1 unnamed protein product [Rotaria socialis]